MAKILFISVYDINAEGIRMMSSLLKESGHQPFVVFLKRLKKGPVLNPEKDWVGVAESGKPFRHAVGEEITRTEENILKRVIRNIGPDVVGFSVCTPTAETVDRLTKVVRDCFPGPIIWGGPHPTMMVSECVDHCDYACVGEGDLTIVEIADSLDKGSSNLESIKGIVCGKKDAVTLSPPCPLVGDLDSLPFKDISPEGKFFIDNDQLITEFKEISYSGNYHLISARGCPFQCTYCCEAAFKKLYFPHKFLRRRTAARVVEEIKQALEIIDFPKVRFEDEVFSLDLTWLEEFRTLYKKDVGLPFVCYLFPMSGLKERIPVLKDAGLVSTVLALQSGSEMINKEVFKRKFNRDVYLESAELLHAEGITIYTDVITYNPFETEQDLQKTLDVLADLPKPFNLDVNKLYILKGTEIDTIAREQKPVVQVPEQVFDLYARLFFLTRWSSIGAALAKLISRGSLFKRNRSFGFLINPYFFNLPFRLINKIARVTGRQKG
jgi:anaerobic magnesium-protoporphyrin IX monomethyl ester cyclase